MRLGNFLWGCFKGKQRETEIHPILGVALDFERKSKGNPQLVGSLLLKTPDQGWPDQLPSGGLSVFFSRPLGPWWFRHSFSSEMSPQ